MLPTAHLDVKSDGIQSHILNMNYKLFAPSSAAVSGTCPFLSVGSSHDH